VQVFASVLWSIIYICVHDAFSFCWSQHQYQIQTQHSGLLVKYYVPDDEKRSIKISDNVLLTGLWNQHWQLWHVVTHFCLLLTLKKNKEGDCFWLIHGLDTSSFLSGIMYENHYAVHRRVLSTNVHRIECNVRKHWLTTNYTAVMMCMSNNLAQM
jgi:hypothetical protein